MPIVDQQPLDRFIVLSLLEDLHIPPVPDPKLADSIGGATLPATDDFCDVDDATPVRDDNILTAGSATDSNEEPIARKKSRVQAINSMRVLATRLGPKWAHSEVVPYLLRCIEESESELATAVAVALPSLVLPGGDHNAEAGPLGLEEIIPVLVALASCGCSATRNIVAAETIPSCFFGISFAPFTILLETTSDITSADPIATQCDKEKGKSDHSNGANSDIKPSIPSGVGGGQQLADAVLRCQDPFDRVMLLTTTRNQAARFLQKVSGADRVGLLLGLIDEIATSHWCHAQTTAIRLVSVLMCAIRFREHVRRDCPRTDALPRTQTQLVEALCGVASSHVTSCLSVWQGGSTVTAKVVEVLAGNTSSPLTFRSLGEVGLRDTMLVPGNPFHALVIAEVCRCLCYVTASAAPQSSNRDICFIPYSEGLAILQQVMNSNQDVASPTSILNSPKKSKAFVPPSGSNSNAAVQRHDESYAGSSFVVMHAACDSLESLLHRVNDYLSHNSVDFAELAALLLGEEGTHPSPLQVSIQTLRLLVARGSWYSLWKNRFQVMRRHAAILDAFARILVTLEMAMIRLVQAPVSATVASLNRTRLTEAFEKLFFDFLDVVRDISSDTLSVLCGDCEAEVRCALSFHAADCISVIGRLMLKVVELQLPTSSSSHTLRCVPLPKVDVPSTALELLGSAQGALASIQVCAMDISDRVRAAATQSISVILQAFSPPLRSPQAGGDGVIDRDDELFVPHSAQIFEALCANENSKKVIDAATAILMDLLRDENHIVHLSVIERVGRILELGAEMSSGAVAALPAQRVEDELLKLCRQLSTSPLWRVRETYSIMLSHLCASLLVEASPRDCNVSGIVGQESISQKKLSLVTFANGTLLPLLVDTLFDPVKAVRDGALVAVCTMVVAAMDESYVNEMLWPLIRGHAKATSTYLMRASLLSICVALPMLDRSHHLLPLLDFLSSDSVANVRLIVAKRINDMLSGPAGGKGSFNDDEKERFVLPLLRRLLEDSVSDVRDCASRALKQCI